MAFQFASTNLVPELGVILWVLMGWQFTFAEFVGGPIMCRRDGGGAVAVQPRPCGIAELSRHQTAP